LTPADLETQARYRYNATGDSHFTTAEIRNAIYQAEMELALECFAIENTTTTASVASTQTLAFPENVIAIRRIEYDGKKILPTDLDSDPKTSTTQVTGTPAQYAIWNNVIYFYPTPDSIKTVKIFHYDEPVIVTTASTTLSVPTRYHTDIIDFILSVMYAKDQNSQMATYHRNMWESNINKIKRVKRKEKRGDQLVVVKDYCETNYGGIIA
jgi:hypothetical protein